MNNKQKLVTVLVAYCLNTTAFAEDLKVCVNKKTGTWRPIAISANCKSSENPLSLSTTTVQGPQGAKGDTGATGPQGLKGANGVDGRAGGISVYDANDQFLGVLSSQVTSESGDPSIQLFLPDPLNALVNIDSTGQTLFPPNGSNPYTPENYSPTPEYSSGNIYTDSNCTSPYTGVGLYSAGDTPGLPVSLPFVIPGGDSLSGKNFLLKTVYKDLKNRGAPVNIKSFRGYNKLTGEENVCLQRDLILYKVPIVTFEATEVKLPFSFPIKPPPTA